MQTNLQRPLRAGWFLPVLALTVFFMQATAPAGSDKPKLVDSGTFSVFVGGKRIANEKFQIMQGPTFSTATSEFKLESEQGRSAQKAELQITSTGDLRRYEWREVSPGKAQIVVEPAEQFLIEHIVPEPPERPVEHPFIVPPSTMVLDDYFFSQREILVWRYLAQTCSQGLEQCRPAKTQFGVLVPRQHTHTLVTLEYAGTEKVQVRGAEQELRRIDLKSEDTEWALYIDSKLKLVRIVIPSEKAEVLRD